ncbi:MAG: hypothetical protein KDK90_15810 [Leptospiraceae bacterium]|nr:hypothetical protein [Leptospiraceae bacterium]
MFKKLIHHPYLIVFIVATLYFAFYLFGFKAKYGIYGDMVGKWIQVVDILQKPVGDFSCNYKEDFDPNFQFIPGNQYFYEINKGECNYMYPYPYAYLVAPFVFIAKDYGFIVLNLILIGLYILFTMLSFQNLLPSSKNISGLIAGLTSFLIIPTGIYVLDFSEMTVSVTLGMVGFFLLSPYFSEVSPKIQWLRVFLAGFIPGIVVAFRTEAILYLMGLVLAIFILGLWENGFAFKGKKSSWQVYLSIKFPFVLGLGVLLSVGIVFLLHQIFFGHILGIRGRMLSNWILSEYDIQFKIKVVWKLLFGGTLGLYSSMPIILLSYLYLFPKVRAKAGRTGLFLFLFANLSSYLIVFTSPGHGGYSWSPRYIALCIPFFLFLILLIGLKDLSLTNKIWKKAILGIVILYSLVFTHTGMKIAKQAPKQIKLYNDIVRSANPDVIILSDTFLYSMLGKDLLGKKIYNVGAQKSIQVDGKEYVIGQNQIPREPTAKLQLEKIKALVEVLKKQNNVKKILLISSLIRDINDYDYGYKDRPGFKDKDFLIEYVQNSEIFQVESSKDLFNVSFTLFTIK